MPVAPADFCSGRWSRRSAALPERSPRSKRVAGLKCVTLRPVGKFDGVDARRTRFDEGAETILCGGVSRRDAAAIVRCGDSNSELGTETLARPGLLGRLQSKDSATRKPRIRVEAAASLGRRAVTVSGPIFQL